MDKLELKDFLTLGNALSGIIGISLAIAGREYAWLYIAPAALFDFLDGKIARKEGKQNAFGRELDSLADVVSFVVAPTVVIMLSKQPDVALTAVSALYVCLGLLRLAWWNLQVDKKHYNGLPTPLAALLVLVVNAFQPQFTVWALVITALAMVTPFKINKM